MSDLKQSTVSGKLAQDVSLAVGLAVALAVVFVLELALSDSSEVPDVEPVVVDTKTEAVVEERAVPPPKLAVTPAEYDDMGSLLRKLGEAYDYDSIQMDDLRSPAKLSEYGIIFLTCGTVPASWLGDIIGEGSRKDTQVRTWKPEIAKEVGDALREFVENGGTLYASDWRFNLIAVAFPELVDRSATAEGDRQEVNAEVMDSGLRELIGPSIKLRFDLPGWKPAAFRGRDVVTYLTGTYTDVDGEQASCPLLVKFPLREGTVIFTSFHNEKQHSEAELELLRYLVFAAITARVESQLTKTMISGGFSPSKQNLLSASSGKLKITKTYTCTKKGDLQFALGFEKRGAELKLEIAGPDGRTFEQTGTSTFTIKVSNAVPGDWNYTVTAEKVPYENFPFTLTVGEKK